MFQLNQRVIYATFIALALGFVMACGDSPLPTSPTITPTLPAAQVSPIRLRPTTLTPEERAALPLDPKASCPDGHYPEHFFPNMHQTDDVVTLFWDVVPGVFDYAIEIDHYDVTNVFLPARRDRVEEHRYDWILETPGRYRARIQTRVCDTQFGPWSPYVFFSSHRDERDEPTPGHDLPNPPSDVVVGPIVPPVPPTPPAPPGSFYSLGANIAPFGGLAGSAITCTTSTITGNVGVSPGSAITGIPGLCTLNGSIISTAGSVAAQSDLSSAYASLSALPCANIAADLNGQLLPPGVYCVPAATFNLTSAMTLNGAGSYTFILPSTFITDAGASVNLTNGATCGGINWVVGSSATIAGSVTGNVIAFSSITLNPGATLTGRALARNAAVTLTTATITNSGCN